MTPEEEMRRGQQAEQVLCNPEFQRAITHVKAKIFDQWCATKFFQRRKREELWKMMRIAEDFEVQLEKAVSGGKFAKKKIEDTEKIKQIR